MLMLSDEVGLNREKKRHELNGNLDIGYVIIGIVKQKRGKLNRRWGEAES